MSNVSGNGSSKRLKLAKRGKAGKLNDVIPGGVEGPDGEPERNDHGSGPDTSNDTGADDGNSITGGSDRGIDGRNGGDGERAGGSGGGSGERKRRGRKPRNLGGGGDSSGPDNGNRDAGETGTQSGFDPKKIPARVTRVRKGKKNFRELEPWLGRAWGLGFSLPALLKKSHPAIWTLDDNEKAQLAAATADLLESLPPSWFDKVFAALERGLPIAAFLSCVTAITVPRLAMHHAWKVGEAAKAAGQTVQPPDSEGGA